jgi:hypothetical protein
VALSDRKKALLAVVVVVVVIATASVVWGQLGARDPGSLSIEIEVVPWQEGSPFWVWIPLMLQDRSADWLLQPMRPSAQGMGWTMVSAPQGSWLNVSGNVTLNINTWAQINDVDRATGLQWSALAPGPGSQTRLFFAAGGAAAGPIAVKLTAWFSTGQSSCSDTARASEMLPGDAQVRSIALEVKSEC